MSALNTFTIVELAEGVAGEYCGKLLADFGARVIKLERPGRGSPTRRMEPLAAHGADGERSGLFAYLNTNKRSVTLDLSAPAGAKALTALVARADAVIDDHAPGWLAGVGLDPATALDAFPRLVLCAITPFGQDAPEDRRHAEDLTVFHASGWGYHTPSGAADDQPPLKGAGRFQVSYEAGLEGAMCTAACLRGARATGRGRVVDISKQEVMASRVDYVLSQMAAGEMDVGPSRRQFDLGGPSGIFPCRDGFIYIWMSAPYHWEGLKTLLGRPAWMEDFPANWLERGVTPERIALVRAGLTEWLATQDKDAAAEAAQKLDLTLVAVNTPADLLRSPQFKHRGFFAEVEHPTLGRVVYPTVPYRMSATPARIGRAAPQLGELRVEDVRPEEHAA